MAAKHNRMIKRAAKKHGIPAKWLYGLWGAEHGLKERGFATSTAGALGPFQFLRSTARSYGINPFKFGQAADAAAEYLSKYKGRGLEGMYRAYNAGPAGGPNPESSAHYRRALQYMKQWPGAKIKGGVEVPQYGIKKRPVKVKQTSITPSKTKIDYSSAIVDAMLAGESRSKGLLNAILDRVDSGEYTTLTPEKRVTKDVKIGTENVIKQKGTKKYGLPAGKGGRVQGGGGYANTEGIAAPAAAIARKMGVNPTGKRSYDSVSGPGVSDHYTGKRNAWAYDLGIGSDLKKGDRLARRIARFYGIPLSKIGTFNRHTITGKGGDKYSVQLLWRVENHYDHVHFGVYRL